MDSLKINIWGPIRKVESWRHVAHNSKQKITIEIFFCIKKNYAFHYAFAKSSNKDLASGYLASI